MPDETHYRKLEHMYHNAPINQIFKPRLHVSEGAAELHTPIKTAYYHPAGSAHGALYFKALDDAAFFAAMSLIDDVYVLTVSFSLTMVRPLTEGMLISRGRVVHYSRRLILAESEAYNEEGKLVAKGSGTFMRSNIPLTPDIGYRLDTDEP